MLFNSYIFVFAFLPLCIIGYFLFNHFNHYKLAQIFLLIMSLIFYAWFNIKYLPIIIVSILINYYIYKLFNKLEKKYIRKAILIIGLIINIGVLIYFKYMDFFIKNVNLIFKSNFNLLNVVLPLGISFFTFQQLSFIIDSYKNEVPKYDLLCYSTFVAFFPQLIAGPIVKHDELVLQFLDIKSKKFNWQNFAKGLYAFTLGLSKKVLIADVFGIAANWGFSNIEQLNTTSAIIVAFSYTIQIYFDFSGYSDMAIGIGKMFNIDLPVNFNSPYKSLNINEFWDRWHITLTRFFTKYVYIPLGGNRKGHIRTYFNIFVVFLISGFWHGANWTFILWGIFHGLFSVVTRINKKSFQKLNQVLNWIITFSFVNFSWIFFRANSVSEALKFIFKILQFDFGTVDQNIIKGFNLPGFYLILDYLNIKLYLPNLLMLLYLVLSIVLILGCRNVYERMNNFNPTMPKAAFISLLLVWCILSFSGISTFLYFNF